MLMLTSRSDLKLHVEAGRKARSRAFFDLFSSLRSLFKAGWTQIKLAVGSRWNAIAKHESQPSGGLHA